MESRGKALFIDIDGTIFKHQGSTSDACFDPSFDVGGSWIQPWYLLSGVRKSFNEWHSKGHRLILTTGRVESMRARTEEQLRYAGLFWDVLLMGVGSGERILINDMSPVHNEPKAIGINLIRDNGFDNINDLYHEAKVKAGAPALVEKYVI